MCWPLFKVPKSKYKVNCSSHCDKFLWCSTFDLCTLLYSITAVEKSENTISNFSVIKRQNPLMCKLFFQQCKAHEIFFFYWFFFPFSFLIFLFWLGFSREYWSKLNKAKKKKLCSFPVKGKNWASIILFFTKNTYSLLVFLYMLATS